MICLRLLAFNPVEPSELAEPSSVKKNSDIKLPETILEQTAAPEISSEIPTPAPKPEKTEQPLTEASPTKAEATPQATETADEEQDTVDHELAAQEAFYHELAQSQGFEPTTGYSEESGPIMQPEAESEQPVEPQKQVEQPTLSSEQTSTVTTPEQHQTAASTPQSDFAGIDNPVLAILAAREAESSAVEQNLERNAESEQQVEVEEVAAEPVYEEPELKPLEHEEVRFAHEVDKWASLIERSGLKGLTRQLALQSAPDINGNHIELTVKQDYAHLLNEKTETELYDVVSRMAPDCEFVINKSEIAQYSPAAIQQNINENRQERAEQSIQQDEFVQTLLNEFEGKLIPDSIKPL